MKLVSIQWPDFGGWLEELCVEKEIRKITLRKTKYTAIKRMVIDICYDKFSFRNENGLNGGGKIMRIWILSFQFGYSVY